MRKKTGLSAEELLQDVNKKLDQFLRDVNKKLDQLIMIISIQASGERSVTDNARMFKTAGLDNETISEILGTTPATIRTLTSNLRKKKR
ncbi:MAG TPA: hypothetical protein VK738_21360 [Terriglobales bacterium]|nr:hypothetical protein [Terriglobales bacterium]